MDWVSKINTLHKNIEPFLCIISFDKQNAFVSPLNELEKFSVKYQISEHQPPKTKNKKHTPSFNFSPIAYSLYKEKFFQVQKQIKKGNTYLLNLTFPTPIELKSSLKEIYDNCVSKYKILFNDTFVCFSPETFVKIEGNKIHATPMKGTIDSTLENAMKILLEDKKEKEEHATIVDFMRNELGKVASDIEVKKYRYIDKIRTNNKTLFHVSSHIEGKLLPHYEGELGTILEKLLPAPSVSGAPKTRSLQIIDEVEKKNRGFYCGIFGVFDGKKFDSSVLIRFIEKSSKFGHQYWSGGGITSQSDVKKEYQELLDKIYVPIY